MLRRFLRTASRKSSRSINSRNVKGNKDFINELARAASLYVHLSIITHPVSIVRRPHLQHVNAHISSKNYVLGPGNKKIRLTSYEMALHNLILKMKFNL